jgi:dolichyl-phosphate-mannose-protein mannosyltransferase
MSSPQGSLKQRGPKEAGKKQQTAPVADALTNVKANSKEALSSAKKRVQESARSEVDYKISFVMVTILAFLTRFWGISHPNEVVFDEVHFGKVGSDNFCIKGESDRYRTRRILTCWFRSSHLITSKAPTSSTSILHSESFCSRSLAGLSDTMANSCSRTSVTPTSQTRCLMSRTAPCLHRWVP